MGQQVKKEWNGDASLEYGKQENVDVLLAVLPVCTVEDEFARTLVWQEGQDDAGDVRWTERVTVEETFNLADDGRGLSASWEALSQFSMADVFGLEKGENDQGEQLDLVLTVVREVSGEATR
ncbi:hypothetical protein ACVWZX_005380 [Deinococcus sp. UYEF24]